MVKLYFKNKLLLKDQAFELKGRLLLLLLLHTHTDTLISVTF